MNFGSKTLGYRKLIKNLLLSFLLSTLATNALAQEGGAGGNCADGMDNDSDGYVDCFDGECSTSPDCLGGSVGQPIPSCTAVPPPATSFGLSEKWRTPAANRMDARQVPVIGDIDGDGEPEVIGRDHNELDELYIFSGVDGTLELTVPSAETDTFLDASAIGDVDSDGTGEIFIVARNGTDNATAVRRRLQRYEHNGALTWTSDTVVGYNANADRWTPHLADFDQDGNPEVYLGNQIFSASTGALLAAGGSTNSFGSHPATAQEPFTVAADVLADSDCANCGGLELVAGNQVYSVDLANGVMTVERELTTQRDGFTSVVDLDRDGDLDAVIGTRNALNQGAVYAWDLQTNTQIGTIFNLRDASTTNTTNAGGHPNIADFNGDGTLEIGLAGRDVYIVIDYNETTNVLEELWSKVTDDGSERTGSTVFDFEGDGANEVVYRDETQLFVYDGATGNTLVNIACTSPTRTEYPTVVDVDGDGATDVVVTCGTQIVAFESPSIPWITARSVSNQHSYFVVNVNDDLTIPQFQQNHAAGLPASAPVNFPFNSFLSQITELDTSGLPTFSSPDPIVSIPDPSTDIDFSSCGAAPDTIDVTLTVTNNGDSILSQLMPASLYSGDPFQVGSTLLGEGTLSSNLAPGESGTITVTIPGNGGVGFDLYVLVNHDADPSDPDPLTATDLTSPVTECDPSNNLFQFPIGDSCQASVVARGDEFTINEDTTLNGDVLADNGNGVDVDPQADNLIVTTTPISPPANGTLSLMSDGTFEYIPSQDFSGLDSFQYEVCDDATPVSCAFATVLITVTPLNDIPDAVDDFETVVEDGTLSATVNTNDIVGDGEPPVFVSGTSNGTLVWNGDGTYNYTPNPDFNGVDTFVYEICDDINPLDCDQATVTITVTSVNDIPIAANDSEAIDEDTVLNASVIANDSFPDGETLSLVSGPSNGSLVFNPDGTYTYTPNADFNGVDSFVYEICDDVVPTDCSQATVTITVNPLDDVPVAEDDNETVTEDGVLNASVLSNDDAPDGELPTLVSGTSNGTLVFNPDGTYTYTPNPDFNGVDSFVYEICDDVVQTTCDPATVTITVTPDNDIPVTSNDNETVPEDGTLNASVLGNDSSPDGELPSLLTSTSNGTLTFNPDGTYTYVPDPNFNGADSFTYEICDDLVPTDCSQATVFITVTPVNDIPVAENDSNTTNEDTAVSGTVISNDSFPDGETPTLVTNPTNGTVVFNPDGTYTYTPNANFNGADTFVYEICDDADPTVCDQATVTININPINDLPEALDDNEIVAEDSSITTSVNGNDNAPDGETPRLVSSPNNGSLIWNGDGTYTYTPDANFNGTDSFVYEICDDVLPLFCDEATVTLVVTGTNDIPIAEDDFETVPEDGSLNATVVPNDFSPDGELPTLVSGPSNGTLSFNPDGTYTYQPNPDFNGVDTFVYEICDDADASVCDMATVTITVTPVNDVPVATDDNEVTNEDTLLTGVSVVPNDTAPDGELPTLVSGVSNGTLTFNPDGSYEYLPDANFNGVDSFVYELCDDANPSVCNQATVTITVLPVNDIPVAEDDAETTAEDTLLSGVTVSPNDSAPDGELPTLLTSPSNGVVNFLGAGAYTYTPDPDFNGVDSFTYEICDDVNPTVCDPATVTITVTPVNDIPIAEDDSATVAEDGILNSFVNFNDSTPDGETFSLVSGPTSGSLSFNPDGSYTFTPDPDFNGVVTFVYEVCDDANPTVCDQASVTIDVLPVNDIPVTADDTETVPEDGVLNADVTPNDASPDGELPVLVSQPSNGTLSWNGDGTYTYTPNPDFNGVDTFIYETCDDETPSICDPATVTINVTPVNDIPIAENDFISVTEDLFVNASVNGNDFAPDGELPVNLVSGPSSGSLTWIGDGTYSYSPNANFNGVDSFVYEICDDVNPTVCDPATVTIDVVGDNDVPIAEDDFEVTDEDTPISTTVSPMSPNDFSPDGELPLLLSNPSNGTLVWNGDNTYTYTPNPDFNGVDSFTYEICDDFDNGTNMLNCDPATVTITINPTNDVPVAEDDFISTGEDNPVSGTVNLNDDAPDGENPSFVSGPSNGSLVFNPDGTYTYTPNADFNGTDSFVYEICDDADPLDCDQATVAITISAINDVPVVADDNEITNEDTPITASVSGNDDAPDGELPVLLSQPPNGTLTWNGDGTYTYTPNPNFFGVDSFTYEICDDEDITVCDEATVTITVNAVNDLPIASNDAETVPEDGSITASVLGNDFNPEGELPSLVTGPANGTLVFNPDGTYTYTPNPDYNGPDSFTYEICDDIVPTDCSQATVSLTITPVNDVPIASDDSAVVGEDSVLNDSVIGNDSLPDGESVDLVSGPSNGMLTLNPDGSYEYIPNPEFSGTDTFTYEICDDADPTNCSQATVSITVLIDSDEDGIPDVFDEDDDNDGVPDTIEGNGDTDGDGIPDSLDLDSDNDGIPDVTEAGGVDVDGDGIIDCTVPFDGNGFCPDVDPADGGVPLADPDTDGDGIPDRLDIDSDNDGIPDVTEAGGLDLDGDGRIDCFLSVGANGLCDDVDPSAGGFPLPIPDFDGDGVPDHLDLDSDNDGIPDLVEAGGEDIDGDGTVDDFVDSDGDGYADSFDSDDDNFPGPNDGGTPLPVPDTDGDGAPDYLDLDSDNDGLLDVFESGGPDVDGDGIIDCSTDPDFGPYGYCPDQNPADGGTPVFPIDTDGDGTPDFQEIDSDGDGLPDTEECPGGPTCPDTDGDGIPDFRDRLCTLEGRLAFPNGDPLSDVTISDSTGALSTTTDSNGDFRIENVLDGLYSITATRPSGVQLAAFDFDTSDPDTCDTPLNIAAEFSLRSPVYFVWNSFYRQFNVIALQNTGDNVISGTISLIDLGGNQLDQVNFSLPANSEQDVLVNALDGYTTQTYGHVKLEFNNPQDFDGHIAQYRIEPGSTEVEFSIARPFENIQVGNTYGSFNTIQPSFRPEDLVNEIPNWIQVVNIDEVNSQSYTINLYDVSGSLIESRNLTLPPRGRFDTQAGHENPGLGAIGSVEVVPADPSVPYLAQLYYYGTGDFFGLDENRFFYAAGETTQTPVTFRTSVPVSTGGLGSNFLVITNTENTGGNINVDIFDNAGTIASSQSIFVPAKGQVHLDMNPIIGPANSGMALLSPQAGAKFVARSVVYFRDADGAVTGIYGTDSRPSFAGDYSGPYNTFLSQLNWLKLFNITNSPTSVDVTVYDAPGNIIGSFTQTVGGLRGVDLELSQSLGMSIAPDTLGRVEVVSSVSGAIRSELLRLKPSGSDLTIVDNALSIPVR